MTRHTARSSSDSMFPLPESGDLIRITDPVFSPYDPTDSRRRTLWCQELGDWVDHPGDSVVLVIAVSSSMITFVWQGYVFVLPPIKYEKL